MLISVIVPVFNAAESLEQCIQSVASQTLADKELIIIDGGSTDGSQKIVASFGKKIAFSVSEPDRGVYDAFNKGIRHSTGDWLFFFGADDFFSDPTALERVAAHLNAVEPQIRIVYGQVGLLGSDDEVLRFLCEPWHSAKKKFTAFMPISHQGVFHRRSLFEELGLFDVSFRLAGDYEFLLREFESHEAKFIPDTIVAMHRSGGLSGRPENETLAMCELRRAQKLRGIGFPRPAWLVRYLAAWVQRGLSAILGPEAGHAATDFLRKLVGKKPHWSKIR